MKSIVTQEFKSNIIQDTLGTQRGSTVSWESPRLTTAYPRPGAEKGADRGICKTVNGVLQVEILEKDILFADNTGVTITAGLWGEYNNAQGQIAVTKYAIDQQYAYIPIVVPPLVAASRPPGIWPNVGYGVPYLESNGALGFNSWGSFSNHAQNIYIKISFVRSLVENNVVVPIPIKMRCSGVLLASDLG